MHHQIIKNGARKALGQGSKSNSMKTPTDTNPWVDSLLTLASRGLAFVGGAAAGAATAASGDRACQ